MEPISQVRLHLCHCQECGDCLTPLSGQDLPAALYEAFTKRGQPPPGLNGSGRRPRGPRVGIHRRALVVLDDAGLPMPDALHVPLSFVELQLCRDSPGGALLVALRSPTQQTQGSVAPPPPAQLQEALEQSRPSRRPVLASALLPRDPTWLIVADDGASLHKALAVLAFAGAVRTDFDEAVRVSDEVLGVGGFGTVKRATLKPVASGRQQQQQGLSRQESLEAEATDVVVKIIVADCGMARQISRGGPAEASDTAGRAPEALPKVVRSEIELLLEARGHPHIINLHAVFKQPFGDWVLMMDFCSGGDLFNLVQKDGALKEPTCIVMLAGLLRSLVHLHSLEIIHRDVKPENLLLHGDSRPVLADFGLACRAADSEETRRRIGSPGFIAPEVLRGNRCCGKSDVFGAGLTLHFCFSGRIAFLGKDMNTTLRNSLSERISYDDAMLYGHLTAAAKDLALTMLSKKPDDRPTAEDALSNPWFVQRPSTRQNLAQCAPSTPSSARSRRPSCGGRVLLPGGKPNMEHVPNKDPLAETVQSPGSSNFMPAAQRRRPTSARAGRSNFIEKKSNILASLKKTGEERARGG